MSKQEAIFHDDLGKVVFNALNKVPIKKVILELEMMKVLLEYKMISDTINATNKVDLDKMYG